MVGLVLEFRGSCGFDLSSATDNRLQAGRLDAACVLFASSRSPVDIDALAREVASHFQ